MNPSTLTFPDLIGSILAEEHTCREYLQALLDRGVKIESPLNSLTHDQCIETVIQIISEIQRSENSILR